MSEPAAWEDLDLKAGAPVRRFAWDHEVQATSELRRIINIPRRIYTPENEAAIVSTYTGWLRKPSSDWTLHAQQAVPLHEARTYGGFFGNIYAGGGKTLLSGLLPMVGEARNPVLLTESGLLEKTSREMRELDGKFHVCTWLRTLGYSALGRASYYAEYDPETKLPIPESGLLERIDPDWLIADECFALANKKSAVTQRVINFLEARLRAGRRVKFCAFSGTITNNSILSYAHLIRYTTPRAWCWLPGNRLELWEWHKAIDKEEVGPGALVQGLGAASYNIADVRRAYADRMIATPTVYLTKEGEAGSSLEFREQLLEYPPEVANAFTPLRKDWEMPDGWRLEDAPLVWAHAQQLSLGFYMAHTPRPPIPWAEARSVWAAWCRHILTYNRRNLESELQVTNSVDAGNEDPEAWKALQAWRAVRPTFESKSKAVWISDVGLRTVRDFLAKAERPTLVWVNHTDFGEACAQWCGVPYFGQKGLTRDGRYIEDHNGHAILSHRANEKGRNLQHRWADNLVTFAAPGGAHTEQLVARTHRYGQKADVVNVTFLIGCCEHIAGLDKAEREAHYAQDTMRQPQRLVYGNLTRSISRKFAGNRAEHRWFKER